VGRGVDGVRLYIKYSLSLKSTFSREIIHQVRCDIHWTRCVGYQIYATHSETLCRRNIQDVLIPYISGGVLAAEGTRLR